MDVPVIKISSLSNAYDSRAVMMFDNKKITEFWLKGFSLPSIDINTVDIPYNEHDLVLEGNRLSFGQLSVDAYLDENFAVYSEQYLQLKGMIPGENYQTGKMNASILMLDNKMQEIVTVFHFEGIMITGIGSLPYNNYGAKEQVLTLSYKFDNFYPEFKITYPTL